MHAPALPVSPCACDCKGKQLCSSALSLPLRPQVFESAFDTWYINQGAQGASLLLVERLQQELLTWKPTLAINNGDVSYARCPHVQARVPPAYTGMLNTECAYRNCASRNSTPAAPTQLMLLVAGRRAGQDNFVQGGWDAEANAHMCLHAGAS